MRNFPRGKCKCWDSRSRTPRTLAKRIPLELYYRLRILPDETRDLFHVAQRQSQFKQIGSRRNTSLRRESGRLKRPPNGASPQSHQHILSPPTASMFPIIPVMLIAFSSQHLRSDWFSVCTSLTCMANTRCSRSHQGSAARLRTPGCIRHKPL